MKVTIKRACYGWGKMEVPRHEREYNIVAIDGQFLRNLSVGTIEEIYQFLQARDIVRDVNKLELEIIDKGETRTEKDVIQFIRVSQLVV